MKQLKLIKITELDSKCWNSFTHRIRNIGSRTIHACSQNLDGCTAGKVHKEAGVEFDFIDFGGGIGIPYTPEESKLDINDFAEKISASLQGQARGI